jgi:hypothetical protein
MTDKLIDERTTDPDADDSAGYMIRLPREVVPPPADPNGGLFPYRFLHPTIADGYIQKDGSRTPYP